MSQTPFLHKKFLVSRYVQRKFISVPVRQPQAMAYQILSWVDFMASIKILVLIENISNYVLIHGKIWAFSEKKIARQEEHTTTMLHHDYMSYATL